MAERLSGKRVSKLPKTFKDYVSADETSRLLVEDEVWFLVQFEDEGQVYCALPKQDVYPIFTNGSEDDDCDDELPVEGDYVDAKWPGDGKLYDAKVIQTGTKTEMRVLRAQIERDQRSTALPPKGKGKKEKHNKSEKREDKKESLQKKKEQDKEKNEKEKIQKKEEQKEKLQKKEEAKARREEAERKRKAELEQAKECAKYFCSKKNQIHVDIPELSGRKTQPVQYKVPQELLDRINELEEDNKRLKEVVQSKKSHPGTSAIDVGDAQEQLDPGVMSPEEARKSKMIPLIPGSKVYLTQEQKNACYNRKPTILVRNLMRVFFNEETLKASNYGGGGPRGYSQLNPAITKAIIGYAMDPSIVSKDDMVVQSKLSETINKLCNEARRGISKQ